MDGREPQFAEAKVSGPTLPLFVGAVVAVGVVAFLLGDSLGRAPAPAPSAIASGSSAPAVADAVVSPALWSAYLNGAYSGWALCAVAADISCTPIDGQPSLRFANFDALPFTTSKADWDLLAPIDVAPGHYVLAGAVTLVDPQLILARVSDAGVATLLSASPQTRWNGILWADVGQLDSGRYLAVTQGLILGQPDAEGRTTARWAGFASGFSVASPAS